MKEWKERERDESKSGRRQRKIERERNWVEKKKK